MLSFAKSSIILQPGERVDWVTTEVQTVHEWKGEHWYGRKETLFGFPRCPESTLDVVVKSERWINELYFATYWGWDYMGIDYGTAYEPKGKYIGYVLSDI